MRIITFGEILLRLAALGNYKLFQKDTLETTLFIAKLPDSDVGHAVVNSLRYFGVDM